MPLVDYGSGERFDQPASEGAGNLMDMIRYRGRLGILNENVPDLVTSSTETAQYLAGSTMSDEDMIRAAYGAIGDNALAQAAANLEALDPAQAYAEFQNLHPGKQTILREYGYTPPDPSEAGPGEGAGGGLFNLPVISQIADFTEEAIETVLPERVEQGLGWGIDMAGAGAGKILSPLKGPVMLGLHALGAPERAVGHIYRWGKEGDERSAGGLGAISHFITNPSQILDAWDETSDGEEYFHRSKQDQAARVLGIGSEDAQLIYRGARPGSLPTMDNLDPATKLYVTRKVVGGHDLNYVLESLDIDPEIDVEATAAIYEFTKTEQFEEASNILEEGKMSFGRNIAHAFGLEHGTTPFDILSGSLDAGAIILTDPFLFLGKANKARRAFRWAVAGQAPNDMTIIRRAAAAVRNGEKSIEAPTGRIVNLGIQDRLEAKSVNRAIDRITDAFSKIDNQTSAGVQRAAVADLIRDMPQLQGGIQDMLLHHRIARGYIPAEATGNRVISSQMDLATTDGVWDYLTSQSGMRQLTGTKMGGIIPEHVFLPRLTNANRAAIWAKAKAYKGIFDPAPNIPPELRREMDDLYGRMLDAEDMDGFMDEFMNWQTRVREYTTTGQKITRPFRNFAHSFFHHVPRSNRLHLNQNDAIEEFRRITEYGALAWMPRDVIDQYVGAFVLNANEGARHLIVNQFLRDIAVRSGIVGVDDEAAQKFIDKFIDHGRQVYALNGTDRYNFREGFYKGGMVMGEEGTMRSDIIAIPDFVAWKHATRKVNIYRRINGAINPQMFESVMQRVWKPAQLMRVSFIPRAAGEELIAFVARRSSREYIESQMALKSVGFKRLRYNDKFGNPIYGWADEVHELAVFRPYMFMKHNMRRLAGKTDEQVYRKAELFYQNNKNKFAKRLSGKTGQAHDDELIKIYDELAEKMRAKSRFFAQDDTEVLARSVSHRLGTQFHEMAKRLNLPTKQQLAYDFLRLRGDETAQKAHDLARRMMIDPTFTRAYARNFANTFDLAGHGRDAMMGRNVNIRSVGDGSLRTIKTKIDISNFRTYAHDDIDMFYHNLSGQIRRLSNSTTASAGVDELMNYMALHNLAEMQALSKTALGESGLDTVRNVRRAYDTLEDDVKDLLLEFFDDMDMDVLESALRKMNDPYQQGVYTELRDLIAGGTASPDYVAVHISPWIDASKLTSDAAYARQAVVDRVHREARRPENIGNALKDSRAQLADGSFVADPVADGFIRMYVPMLSHNDLQRVVGIWNDADEMENLVRSIHTVLRRKGYKGVELENKFNSVMEMITPATKELGIEDVLQTAQWHNIQGIDFAPATFIASSNPDDVDIIVDILQQADHTSPRAFREGMQTNPQKVRSFWQKPRLPEGVPEVPEATKREMQKVVTGVSQVFPQNTPGFRSLRKTVREGYTTAGVDSVLDQARKLRQLLDDGVIDMQSTIYLDWGAYARTPERLLNMTDRFGLQGIGILDPDNAEHVAALRKHFDLVSDKVMAPPDIATASSVARMNNANELAKMSHKLGLRSPHLRNTIDAMENRFIWADDEVSRAIGNANPDLFQFIPAVQDHPAFKLSTIEVGGKEVSVSVGMGMRLNASAHPMSRGQSAIFFTEDGITIDYSTFLRVRELNNLQPGLGDDYIRSVTAHELGHILTTEEQWARMTAHQTEYYADQFVPDELRPGAMSADLENTQAKIIEGYRFELRQQGIFDDDEMDAAVEMMIGQHLDQDVVESIAKAYETHPAWVERFRALDEGAHRTYDPAFVEGSETPIQRALGRDAPTPGQDLANPWLNRTYGRVGYVDTPTFDVRNANTRNSPLRTQPGKRWDETDYFTIEPGAASHVTPIDPDRAWMMYQVEVPDPENSERIIRQWWSHERLDRYLLEQTGDIYRPGYPYQKVKIVDQHVAHGQTEESGVRMAASAEADSVIESTTKDLAQRNNLAVLHSMHRHANGGKPVDIDVLLHKASIDHLPTETWGPEVLTAKEGIWGQVVREWFDGNVSPAVEAIIRKPMFHSNLVHAHDQTISFYNNTIDRTLQNDFARLVGQFGLEVDDFDDISTFIWNSVRHNDHHFLYRDGEVAVEFTRNLQLADSADQIRAAFKTAGYAEDAALRGMADGDVFKLKHAIENKFHAWENHNAAMIDRATTLTIPYIDDHRIRSQFQEHMGGMLPFWYAEEQFLKRWARGLYESPEALRKGQMIINGFRDMGVIQDDGQGNEMFVWPASEEVMTAIGHLIEPAFGEQAKFVISNPLTSRTDFMFPGFREDVGRMEFGPLPAMTLNTLATRYPELSDFRDDILGEFGASRTDMLANMYPSYLVRFANVLGMDPPFTANSGTALASAQMEAMQYMAANDRLPPEDATPLQMEEFLHDMRDTARVILGTRAVTGFIAPTTMSPHFEGEFNLQETEFRELISMGMPYQEALRVFLENNPNATAHTVFQTRSASGAPIPSTVESLDFMRDHGQLLDEFPMAGPWLIPQTNNPGRYGMEERRARQEALARELRIRRSPEEYLEQLYFNQSVETYTDALRAHQTEMLVHADDRQMREYLQENWRAWSDAYKRQHPVFAAQFTDREAQLRRERTIDEVTKLVNAPELIPDSVSHKQDFLDLAQLVANYDYMMGQLKYQTGSDARELRDQLRFELYQQGERIAMANPAVNAFFSSVVLNVIGQENVLEFTTGEA